MTFPIYDDNVYRLNLNDPEQASPKPICSLNSLIAGNVEKIPQSSVVKQLALALEKGKNFSSMKDLLAASTTSSPGRVKAERGMSAVKSFVMTSWKDERTTPELIDDQQFTSLIKLLFGADRQFLSRKNAISLEACASTTLPRDIHAAPPECFVTKLSEVFGHVRSMKNAAKFWLRVVAELRRIWSEEEHICGIPLDETPDLDCCLLYQQLQVINCCISRKRRRLAAIESLELSSPESKELGIEDATSLPKLYARLSTGELVLRQGADHKSDDLVMLETGEPIYYPATQESPLLTEDLIKETEEFVLQTGSVGAGCSHLLSDMQAFKAANPGCILEDFVRWHSPPDWTDSEEGIEDDDFFDGSDVSSKKGFLSKRMQKEGNLWLTLWDTAKPVPAAKQAPLFDEDLAVEGILSSLEKIPPSELYKQLFVSSLVEGLLVAEVMLTGDENVSKVFYECKEFIVRGCQGNIDEKIQDLCEVYETIETMLLKSLKQRHGEVSSMRFGFMGILGLSFGSREIPENKDGHDFEEKNQRTGIASFFRNKSSLFLSSSGNSCTSPSKENLTRSHSWLVT